MSDKVIPSNTEQDGDNEAHNMKKALLHELAEFLDNVPHGTGYSIMRHDGTVFSVEITRTVNDEEGEEE